MKFTLCVFAHYDSMVRLINVLVLVPDLIPIMLVGTLLEFKNAIYYLKMAQIYAQRVDWLVSGDDGELSFLQALKYDLAKLERPQGGDNAR